MDPQSLSFTPQSPDLWQLSNAMRSFQEVQQDHDTRLRSLERRYDGDSRVRSVWGGNSPFPTGVTGTPHLGATSQPPGVDFSTFDDDNSNNMMRSLQLDAEDPPRRLGATSRANSVRFDESANQNQWSHASRASGEFTRTSSGLGGIAGGFPMFERTASHKSEGRQSSTGHSVSGRANSLGLDIGGSIPGNTDDVPGIAPGLFLLGTVPAIIRCWMTTDYTHDSLLYAAVCTGSYRSFLDERIIHNLGYEGMIRSDIRGTRKIKLPLYLPEAIPSINSSRSSSPNSQLSCPSIVVDFNVLEAAGSLPSPKAIQIFLGSDMLRAHNADILFSSNSLSIYDSNRDKLSIPFVRPEDEATFKGLYITTHAHQKASENPGVRFSESMPDLNSLTNGARSDRRASTRSSSPDEKASQGLGTSLKEDQGIRLGVRRSPSTDSMADRARVSRKPSLTAITTMSDNASNAGADLATPATGASSRTPSTTQPSPATAVWGSWRRDGSQASASGNSAMGSADWAARAKRETGIKVLKPARQTSRSASSAAAPLSSSQASVTSPTTAQSSRFFDEGGKRRGAALSAAGSASASDVSGGEGRNAVSSGASGSSKSLPRGAGNPIGGASAFGWLNSGGAK